MPRFVSNPFVSCFLLFCFCIVCFNVSWFLHSVPADTGQTSSKDEAVRTSPEEILNQLTAFLRRSREEYNATARRILLRSIAYRRFSNRIDATRHPEAHVLRSAFETHSLLPCLRDAELLNGSSRGEGMLFVASVVKDAEDVMPNFVVQLCRLVLHLAHGHRRLFVSLYESGSRDATPQWLLVAKALLDVARCPNSVVIHGAVRRRPAESRLQFAARLRNTAMEPLRRFGKHQVARVVFVDDVFFCAQQILRLEALDVDIGCGMDFVASVPKRRWGRWKAKPDPLLLVFRDVWSSMDITGRHFKELPPFVLDAYGRELMYKGAPFPVHCCSNGMMVMKAAPFFMNVTFRGRPSGECPASENLLLCEDFVKSGFGRIAVDPSLKVAHGFKVALNLHRKQSNGRLEFVPYTLVDKKIGFPHHPRHVECCERLEDNVRSSLKFQICRKVHSRTAVV